MMNDIPSRRRRRRIRHHNTQQPGDQYTEHFVVRLSHEGHWEVDADCVLRRIVDENGRWEGGDGLI